MASGDTAASSIVLYFGRKLSSVDSAMRTTARACLDLILVPPKAEDDADAMAGMPSNAPSNVASNVASNSIECSIECSAVAVDSSTAPDTQTGPAWLEQLAGRYASVLHATRGEFARSVAAAVGCVQDPNK